jgi:PAS domain S-box-containing protein
LLLKKPYDHYKLKNKKDKQPNVRHELLDMLRQKAEELLGNAHTGPDHLRSLEVQKLFHEVQIYQLELEMQNDELGVIARQLEGEKSKFTSLFENAPVGYLVLNNRGIITDVNSTAVKLLGRSKAVLTGKSLPTFVFKEDISAYYRFFKKIVTNAGELSCQLRMLKNNQDFFFALLNGSGVDVNKSEPLFYITIIDVTEKIRVSMQLQESKKYLDLALNVTSTGIWEVNVLHGNVKLDDFSFSIFGIEPKNFDGKYNSLLNLIDVNDRERVDAALRSAMVREKEFNTEFRICNITDEPRYVAARGQIVQDEKSRRLVGIISDITEKKELERKAAQLKESQRLMLVAAALQGEENERKRISEALHDSVGQMLYAIKLNFQQLKGILNTVVYEQTGQLLDQTIRDVRNISFELAPSILTDFGLAATLEEMSKRLSGKNLEVSCIVKGIDAKLDKDFALNIFRIVQELVGNSIKHGKPDKIWVDLHAKNSLILIEVKDNGEGFKLGYEQGPNKGTGLSSIRNRINLYQGKMDIGSVNQKGALIKISLKQPG